MGNVGNRINFRSDLDWEDYHNYGCTHTESKELDWFFKSIKDLHTINVNAGRLDIACELDHMYDEVMDMIYGLGYWKGCETRVEIEDSVECIYPRWYREKNENWYQEKKDGNGNGRGEGIS